jgi:hypothetical protein
MGSQNWGGGVLSPACEFNSTTEQVYRERPPGLLQRQTTLSVFWVSVKQNTSRDKAVKSKAVNVTKHHTTGGVEVISTHSGHQ